MDDDFSIVSHKSTSSFPEIGHSPHCTQIGNFIFFVSIFTLNVCFPDAQMFSWLTTTLLLCLSWWVTVQHSHVRLKYKVPNNHHKKSKYNDKKNPPVRCWALWCWIQVCFCFFWVRICFCFFCVRIFDIFQSFSWISQGVICFLQGYKCFICSGCFVFIRINL